MLAASDVLPLVADVALHAETGHEAPVEFDDLLPGQMPVGQSVLRDVVEGSLVVEDHDGLGVWVAWCLESFRSESCVS